MRKSNEQGKISYEPEADILRIEASRRPIDYASEIGNVIVHFSREGVPVYFEILQAKNFLKQASTLIRSPHKQALTPVN